MSALLFVRKDERSTMGGEAYQAPCRAALNAQRVGVNVWIRVVPCGSDVSVVRDIGEDVDWCWM